jgi:hypothetical protein
MTATHKYSAASVTVASKRAAVMSSGGRYVGRHLIRGLAGIALLLSALTLSACNSTSLGSSTTCRQFMSATPQQQQQVLDQLATQYNKPDYATPLGSPEVPYYCSANPSVTLGQFFKEASD